MTKLTSHKYIIFKRWIQIYTQSSSRQLSLSIHKEKNVFKQENNSSLLGLFFYLSFPKNFLRDGVLILLSRIPKTKSTALLTCIQISGYGMIKTINLLSLKIKTEFGNGSTRQTIWGSFIAIKLKNI